MLKIFIKIKSLTKTTFKEEGKGFNYNGNKQRLGNGRRPSGME
jgi:hypothetical protein